MDKAELEKIAKGAMEIASEAGSDGGSGHGLIAQSNIAAALIAQALKDVPAEEIKAALLEAAPEE